MSQPIPVPNIEFTLRQCATLNGIIGDLFDRLPCERAGLDSGAGGCTDANANDSLCTSLILACNRLDDILKDDARWALREDTHDTLLQIAKMEREIMKSRVLSENLGREITKAQLYGAVMQRLDLPEVPDTRAPQVSPAPKAPVKKQTKHKK